MKKIKTVIVLFLWLINAFSINAVQIQKLSKIQPAGLITFKAFSSYQNSKISWRVFSYTIDENTGTLSVSKDTVKAIGDTLQVVLIKQASYYTYYKVFAFENDKKDSLEILVFNKGVRQKYLYKNPYIPSKPIPVYVILPTKYPTDSKFIVSMHGINRNANDYVDSWRDFANTNNYVVAAPEFSSNNWSNSGYNLGNMFTGSNGAGALNPKEYWSFFLVQEIHKEIFKACGLKDSTYIIWGHSAGGQFVHRLALFCPDPLVTKYIASNSGTFTAPDTNVNYPWGTKHSSLNIFSNDLVDYTNRNLIIMRGTADTLRDSNLNTDPLSDAQGRNRFERAAYFFNKGVQINSSLIWKLIDVPNVGHDYKNMAISAGDFLLHGVTSVERLDNEIPERINIYNYPNPFNPTTVIGYRLPVAGHVTLRVFDLLGREIVTLVNEEKQAGKYEVKLDGNGLASGIYFYQLITNKTTGTMKMILQK